MFGTLKGKMMSFTSHGLPFNGMEPHVQSRFHCVLNVNYLQWCDDALLVRLKKTKTDQEGINGKTPYHVYLNSADPYFKDGIGNLFYFKSRCAH